jgi:putative ABC transport system substrate-binding protein
MIRRVLLFAVCCALAAPALATEAPLTVLMLLYRGVTEAEKGFMDYLKSRIPVEFIVRDAGADTMKIEEFVREAKRIRPNLIYTFGTTVTLATVGPVGKEEPERHIADIPVVFNIVADPVGAGLARGFVATGRNLTGVSHLVPLTAQLMTMQRVKAVKRLGVVYNPHEANSVLTLRELKQHAGAHGFTLIEAALAIKAGTKVTSSDVASAVRTVLDARPDFIYLPSDSSLIQQAAAIVGPSKAAGVPIISATESPIRREGALMGLVSSYYNAGTYAGYMAEQILAGRKNAGSIAIDTLQRFTLLMNMSSAVELGVYPPLDLIPIAELLR